MGPFGTTNGPLPIPLMGEKMNNIHFSQRLGGRRGRQEPVSKMNGT